MTRDEDAVVISFGVSALFLIALLSEHAADGSWKYGADVLAITTSYLLGFGLAHLVSFLRRW